MAIYASLRDVPVLITGGGNGIGATMVEMFAGQGAAVAFLDADAEGAARVCEQVAQRHGATAAYAICDLRAVDEAVSAADELAQITGPFRVLVNNAGSDAPQNFGAVTSAMFDDRVAVNLKHQFFMAQSLAPGMAAAGGGSIINLGSVCWRVGVKGVPVYATLKSAVEGLTKTLARELGEQNIRVNAIAPGWVLTEAQQRKLARDPHKSADYLARQCLKQHLRPQDVAEMALWLAADESSRCTGHVYFVDAGVT